jgi:hypothetical protein
MTTFSPYHEGPYPSDHIHEELFIFYIFRKYFYYCIFFIINTRREFIELVSTYYALCRYQ